LTPNAEHKRRPPARRSAARRVHWRERSARAGAGGSLATGAPAALGTFLVDTGASGTCVDRDLIKGLGLQPTGRTAISTPSTSGTPHYCDQYDVALFIPGNPGGGGHIVAALPIITTHLRSQGIDGLLGRDVLNNCVLIYNGNASILTLAY
jgi:Aspartyl protease